MDCIIEYLLQNQTNDRSKDDEYTETTNNQNIQLQIICFEILVLR